MCILRLNQIFFFRPTQVFFGAFIFISIEVKQALKWNLIELQWYTLSAVDLLLLKDGH